MAENEKQLQLKGLREDVREPLRFFAERLKAELGENLKSITVVGSSLTKDFKPGRSDINTIIVLKEQNIEALNKIAGMAKSLKKKNLSAPLLMTPDYIERSADVFGIEFLDIQLTHETIFGEDAFSKMSFVKADVRFQCERELKASLIRLRQGYISAAANTKLVRDVVISAGKNLTPLLRAMLWLKDLERPQQEQASLEKAEKEFSIKMKSLPAAASWRREKIRPTQEQVENTFEAIYKTIDKLAVLIDKLEV